MEVLKKIVSKARKLLKSCRMLYYFTNRKLIGKAVRQGGLRLHLGCGNQLLDGWLNIDIRRQRARVVVMKLPKGLKKFGDNSVRYIYASHLWEHLEYPGVALRATKECYRILRPGGVLRIVVPGIERIIRAYVEDDREFFKIQEQIHPPSCTTRLEHLMQALQLDGEHKYGYDFETMSKLLSQAGFSRIIDSDYNKSQIEDLRIDYRGENLSLFVDAIK